MAKDIIVIDYETYYDKDYSLSKLTTQQYIDDPRFEVIGVAVKVNDEPTQWFSGTKEDTAIFLSAFNWGDAIAVAHNALFDASILTWQFGITPFLWADTLSMARAVHGTEVGGSLAKLVTHYDLGAKGTEVVHALGKRRQDMIDDGSLEAYKAYCILDVELTRKLFDKLAPHFDKTEIRLIDMTIRMHSEPSLMLDEGVLEDHLRTVRANKAMLLMQCLATRDSLMSNNKFAEILKERNVRPPTKISKTTGKLTYAFAKTDEGMKRLLEHPDPEVQALAAARVGTKSTLEETRTERFIAMAESGGALPVPLKYYGAMTGRWAAADKTNLQNIPRGSKLKEAIVAPKGFKIVGADLSNIELRVGLYFAGQMDKLYLLRDGVDLYKDFAAPVFGVAYDEVTEEQRFLGKTSQLSLIYGTGGAKLRAAILQMANKDIGEAFADYVVSFYREQYPKVQGAWGQARLALEAIMRNDDTFIMGQPNVLPLNVHGTSGILLPSKLYLAYPDLKAEFDSMTGQWKTTYASRKERIAIHGAKCYQNVIQALARCVMGEAMVRIGKAVPVALTIHDAVYCVVPESEVEHTKRLIVSELKKEPIWAPGLPLDAECGSGQSLSFKMKKLEA